jgi:alpha-mannosidase
VTGNVIGEGKLPEKSFSLLKISNANVLLFALKPAEEGITNGLIARVWNLSTDPQRFAFTATGIASAKQATHIETDFADVPVVGKAASPSQLLTFRLISTTNRRTS